MPSVFIWDRSIRLYKTMKSIHEDISRRTILRQDLKLLHVAKYRIKEFHGARHMCNVTVSGMDGEILRVR